MQLVEMVSPSDYMTTSDDKSGYWQMAMHPDSWKYLAFKSAGKVYCWVVAAFGLMDLPYKFTIAKQVVYQPLRQMGAQLLSMLDDRAAVESTLPRARLQVEALNSVLVALGTVLNIPDASGKKAQWLPSQRITFLGFEVDARQQSFSLLQRRRGTWRKQCKPYCRQIQYPTGCWPR